MSKYKWMPILKTGNFTDKNGQEISIDENKLDQVITNTDLSKEPQFVIDHPGFDEVGFGTIEKLKRVGQYLFALPKSVNEKFKKAVNAGKLPSRSVTLDKHSLCLKNISFLNIKSKPAVDGLGGYSFSEGQNEVPSSHLEIGLDMPGIKSHFADLESGNYEFARYEVSNYPFRLLKDILSGFRDFVIEKFSIDAADKLFPKWMLEEIGIAPDISEASDSDSGENADSELSKEGSNADINISSLPPDIQLAIGKLENKINSLEEDLTHRNIELQKASIKIEAAEKEKLRSEVIQFCKCDEVKLKIKPADFEKTVAFIMAQKDKGVIELSGPDNSDCSLQLDAFEFSKQLIKALPDVIELGELATRSNAADTSVPEYKTIAKAIADAVR